MILARAAALLLVLSAGPAFAGKLDDFERDASKPEPAPAPQQTSSDEDSDGFFEALFEEFFWELFKAVIGGGGAASLERAVGAGLEPRAKGEAAIPFVRTDATFQDVRSDVTALDLRAEAGYGPLALEARKTRYTEKTPRDHMTLSRVHLLYRMSFSRHVEVGMGAGVLTLEGNERHSGVSFTLPVQVHALGPFGIHYRPVWGGIAGAPMDDYTLGASYGGPYFSLSAGYRWVNAGEESLDGPCAGLSLHF